MVKNRVFVFLLLGLFLISFASAWEGDNAISDYDESTETITFRNGCLFDAGWTCLGSEIGQVQLKTPKDFKVARGYNYVWEMDALVNEDYNDFLKGFEFEDMNNGKAKVNRDIDIKILSYEDVVVDDYESYDCGEDGFCEWRISGTHIETQEVWTKITPADLKKNEKVTLRGYTNVQEGDKIDWSPLIFGVRVSHDIWAEWSESWEVGNSQFYKLDESSGTTAIDFFDNYNGTNTGADIAQPGVSTLLNYSYDFVASNCDFVEAGSGVAGDTTVSFAGWLKSTSDPEPQSKIMLINTDGATDTGFGFGFYQSAARIILPGVAWGSDGAYNPTDGNWHSFVVTKNVDVYNLYMDGNITSISTYTSSGGTFGNFIDFGQNNEGLNCYDGYLDNIGIWDRVLTSQEIIDWDNGGMGITPTTGTAPAVTLTSPANNSNLTSENIDFITTVTDDQLVVNVSLFIDGVINETNTSGFNGTYTFSKVLAEGVHNWSILAFNNQSLSNQSETRIFNFTQPPINIELNNPSDAFISEIPLINVSCSASDTLGVEQLNLTINGVVNETLLNSTAAENLTISKEINFSEGIYLWGCSAVNEMSFAASSNRTLNVTYSSPVISDLSPADNSNTTLQEVNFDANVTDINGIGNVTLYLNGIVNETNTSGLSGSYSFSRVLAEGIYNWSISANSILSKQTNSSDRSLIVHLTAPNATIIAPRGDEGYLLLGENEILEYSFIEPGQNLSEHLDECWYVYNPFSNSDNVSYTTNGTVSVTNFSDVELIDGFSVNIFGKSGDISSARNILNVSSECFIENASIKLVNVAPGDTAQNSFCFNGTDYVQMDSSFGYTVGQVVTLNSINTSLDCEGNQTNFTYFTGLNNITIYARDTFGFLATDTSTWNYKLLEESTTYNAATVEGSTETFELSMNSSGTVVAASLVYNGTSFSTSIFSPGGGIYNITSTITVPDFTIDTNATFYFEVTFLDSTILNTSENTQFVSVLLIDDCTNFSNLLLNISLFDEQTIEPLVGTIEADLVILDSSGSAELSQVSSTFFNSDNFEICANINLSEGDFLYNLELRYFVDPNNDSNFLYVPEFYHIQKAPVSNFPQSVDLFDLNANDSTEFIITYQNNDFIFVEGAIVQLQRKYVGEGLYRVVEAPITADGGKAVVHIDLNTNKYRATVVKDGELLDTFEDIVFNCENELSGQCEEELEGNVNSNNDIPVTEILDFIYSIATSEDNQTVTVSFSVPSGTPAIVNVALEQFDMFDNVTTCNNTIVASAGSIICTYNSTIEKSILQLEISKDDANLAILSYSVNPPLDMDGINFFIVFLFMISLVGMAIASPEWIMIIAVMVLMISGTLLLVSGMSLVIGLGAIAWLVVAVGIMVLKMSKQEDR